MMIYYDMFLACVCLRIVYHRKSLVLEDSSHIFCKSDVFIDFFWGLPAYSGSTVAPGPQKTYHTPLTPKVSMGLSAHEVQFHGCCTKWMDIFAHL